MNDSAMDFQLTAKGCNYCESFETDLAKRRLSPRTLDELVEQVKFEGKGRDYDCIVGLSGGVDSAFTLLKVKELGLRPLAVHMDNGWNSELATNNIKNLVQKLEVDLFTHVIDWGEYRDLLDAFLKADVVDSELLYDNAMLGVNFELCKEHKIKTILAGTNFMTEGLRMPPSWNWLKTDATNIKAIHKRFGLLKEAPSFPYYSLLRSLWDQKISKVKWVSFLDYITYVKSEALERLKEEFAYKPYPYKHYESIFTRFYQGFILPVKFGIDKRRLHFSTLILSGQMTREAAQEDLKKIPYASWEVLFDDTKFFIKKMKWSVTDLENYLKRPRREHNEFGSDERLYHALWKTYNFLKGKNPQLYLFAKSLILKTPNPHQELFEHMLTEVSRELRSAHHQPLRSELVASI